MAASDPEDGTPAAAPEEIEAFADGDPYVTAGLVTARRIERWNLV